MKGDETKGDEQGPKGSLRRQVGNAAVGPSVTAQSYAGI